MTFDGISDISDLGTRLLTYIGKVSMNRLVSIIDYAAKTRINPMINTLLSLVPDEFTIPDTNLTVEGGISDKFNIVEGKYIMMPFDISF